jgi:hypothetical protein
MKDSNVMKDNNALLPRGKALWLALLLPLALMVSGCQEDRGQFKAKAAIASEASENRLDNAVSSLQETLGQKPPAAVDRPTLKWEAPATREDGSRLYASDIKEYRIYYRLRHQAGFKAISHPVNKGNAFRLNRFGPGAYEFSVTAVDNEGRESRRSDGVAVNLI